MEIRDICFSYGEKMFINKLNGCIERGKITTILGPNGSGKSTLLNILVRHLQPKSGDIFINGEEMSKMSRVEIAKKIAMVHQQNFSPEDITVERLVSFGRIPYEKMFFKGNDTEAEAAVNWAISVTKLDDLREKNLGELSGGQRQRVWIAMSLAQKTDILFLDEPTTYLDIYYQYEILSLVKRLNEEYGITIVMVLHDINQAIQFSDNLIIMKKGKIYYEGSVAQGMTERCLEEVYGIQATIQWSDIHQCPYMLPLLGV